ncbi:MAG: ATP-grasp domain-containing protein [Alphaproteobacteria bacterium]|nr:ATP-grasp domain-containing protein [Alphaproteobacteria bacterium]
MRIFICEYITGGGLQSEDLPPSLVSLTREGEMMLAALVGDLSAVQTGVGEIIVSRDPRLPAPSLSATFVSPEDGEDIWAFWGRHMENADAFWPIAPETDGAMERLCHMAKERGVVLLASTPKAIRITASKRATAALLREGGVAVVPCYSEGDEIPPSSQQHPGGWVVKPDDGAGAEETRILPGAEEARDWLGEHPGHIIQPYMEGEVASLSLLCRDGQASLLSCNRQRITMAGGDIRVQAIEVGGMENHREAFSALADAIAALLPGLWGYNGIDVICGTEGITVLEINPRLTTSYVGLGESLGVNPAGLVLGLLEEKPLPDCTPQKTITVEMGEMSHE